MMKNPSKTGRKRKIKECPHCKSDDVRIYRSTQHFNLKDKIQMIKQYCECKSCKMRFLVVSKLKWVNKITATPELIECGRKIIKVAQYKARKSVQNS